jgi:DNA-binding transcriptional LysR family regulator
MIAGMRAPQLSAVDLNLLPALAALLNERSVSRAAESVGLSQSAMSRSLARLRRTLGDKLLVRADGGYQLTPAAEQLVDRLDDLLPRLHEMFLDAEYRPAAATREFRLAGTDAAVALFGPPVVGAIRDAAPRSTVRFLPWHSGIARDLAGSRIDLLFSGTRPAPPTTGRLLFTDEMVCVLDRDHPLAGKKSLTMDQYLRCDHLVLDVDEGAQPSVDAVLSARGRVRRASLVVPYHAVAPALLGGTDLVLSMPATMVGDFVAMHRPRLSVLRAPADIRPVPHYLSWHVRQQHNKGHLWLRDKVFSAVQGSGAADRPLHSIRTAAPSTMSS